MRNDYSVPHTCVQRSLTVLADAHTVRILDGLDLVATHVRCYDAGAQIEIAAHLEALTEHKRAARGHRAMDRLHYAAPSAKLLYQRAGERGAHLGSLTRGLLELLDSHGAQALEAAVVAALTAEAAHLASVRHFIDSQAHARGQLPPVAVRLPVGAKISSVAVRPHALGDYDLLNRDNDHDPSDTER